GRGAGVGGRRQRARVRRPAPTSRIRGRLRRPPSSGPPSRAPQALRRNSSTRSTSPSITRSSSFFPRAFEAFAGSPVTPDQYRLGSATTAYGGISFLPAGERPFTRSGFAVRMREVSPAPAWPSPSGERPSVGNRRRDERARSTGDLIEDVEGLDHVRPEGQVAAVLLEGADRQDDHGVLPGNRGELLGRYVGEAHARESASGP